MPPNNYTWRKFRVRRQKSPGWRTAIEIAISSPVTVSIGLLINGVLSTTFLVMRLSVMTSWAEKSIFPGSIRKSLYVRPPWRVVFISFSTDKPSGSGYLPSSSRALDGSRNEREVGDMYASRRGQLSSRIGPELTTRPILYARDRADWNEYKPFASDNLCSTHTIHISTAYSTTRSFKFFPSP